MRAGVGVYFYNAPISSHPGRVTLGTYASKPPDLVSFQGRIPDFFRRGCTRLLLYFKTNKPDSFFFGRIPVVLENRRSSWGGVRTPCTLPLDLPLVLLAIFSPRWGLHYLKGSLGERPKGFSSLTEPPTIWNWTSASLQSPGTPPSPLTHLRRGTD